MNQVIAPFKKLLNPLCSMLQTNKSVIALVLVLFVVFMMLPIDLVMKSNMKANVISNLKGLLGIFLHLILVVLVLCFFFNNDVVNLVLTLSVYCMLFCGH